MSQNCTVSGQLISARRVLFFALIKTLVSLATPSSNTAIKRSRREESSRPGLEIKSKSAQIHQCQCDQRVVCLVQLCTGPVQFIVLPEADQSSSSLCLPPVR